MRAKVDCAQTNTSSMLGIDEFHPIQLNIFVPLPQNEIVVPYTDNQKMREVPSASPAREARDTKQNLCGEASTNGSESFGDTCSYRFAKVLILDFVAEQSRGTFLILVVGRSQQFRQHDPYGAHIHKPPRCYVPLMSSRTFLPIRK